MPSLWSFCYRHHLLVYHDHGISSRGFQIPELSSPSGPRLKFGDLARIALNVGTELFLAELNPRLWHASVFAPTVMMPETEGDEYDQPPGQFLGLKAALQPSGVERPPEAHLRLLVAPLHSEHDFGARQRPDCADCP